MYKFSYLFRIHPSHAKIRKLENEIYLCPSESSKTYVQGVQITDEIQLRHNNYILFGYDTILVFNDPKSDKKSDEEFNYYKIFQSHIKKLMEMSKGKKKIFTYFNGC